jgi:hypothetical protein
MVGLLGGAQGGEMALFKRSGGSPAGSLEAARRYLHDEMTKAAQASFPFGQVVVVYDELSGSGTSTRGVILVMAGDRSRPYHRDEVADRVRLQLERRGWTTTVKVESGIKEVAGRRPELGDFWISVLCNADDPITHWNSHTPVFPA